MSSGIILLIVAVVIIVITVYIIGVILRKRNDQLIEKLEARKQDLFELPVNDEVEAVKALHLIGQSQETFREWNQKWIDLSLNAFTEVENHIFEAENYNDTFNFFKAKSEIELVESQLKVLEEDISSIRESLSSLREQEEKNSGRVKHALDLYEKLQESIKENEDNFGSTMSEIERQLSTIEHEFSQFVTLNSSGDPVEAAEVLEKAEEHTIALGQITERIPAIVAKLEDDFPDQLDDLETGYRRLIEEHYHFAESDIEKRFQEVREAISANESELASLDLDRAIEENKSIQTLIDKLYETFEAEISARNSVNKSAKILPSYIEHAKGNNEKLQEELDRLSKTYILNENHQSTVNEFAKTLDEMEEKVNQVLENITDQDQPFTRIKKIFDNSSEQLDMIEQGQIQVFNELSGVERTEMNARDNLDVFVNKLHSIKRFMEKRNLPGIPDDFLQVFFSTSSQIENLMDELSKGRINIETVNRLSEIVTSQVSLLESTTYEVVQNATLTEQLLQYSNRYRSFEPSVQSAFERSLKLFEHDFDYQGSFDEISFALENVEPGVTERFVISYEKNRENIRF